MDRAGTVEWARRAEEAGFSSLGTLGRIAFPNYEELVSLAAAAAVTERVRLVTDVLLAPLHRNTALLAKQAARTTTRSRASNSTSAAGFSTASSRSWSKSGRAIGWVP